MIGGYYVTAIEATANPPGREMVALVAGPFATWAEADKLGPAVVKRVASEKPDLTINEYGVCEFWFHRLVLGVWNAQLWANPTPVER
jgi:hypothetical protein